MKASLQHFLLFFYLLIAATGFGQKTVAQLHEKFEATINNNPDEALEIALQALEISKDKSKEKVVALNDVGNAYHYLDEYEDAEVFLTKATSLAKEINYPKGHADSYKIKGNMFIIMGRFSDAVNFFGEAIKIYESIQDPYGRADCHNGIGLIHLQREDYEKALEYFNYALQDGDDETQGDAYVYMAQTYLRMESYQDAKKFAEKAYKIAEKYNDLFVLSAAYDVVGFVLSIEKSFDQSNKTLHKSLKIKETVEDGQGMAFTMIRIGLNHKAQGNNDSAKYYMSASYRIAEDIGSSDEQKQSAKELAKLLSNEKKYDSAFFYQSKFIEINDLFYKEHASKKIAEMEAAFESDRKQKEIEQINREKAFEAKKYQFYFITGGIILLVILIGLIFMYKQYQAKKKANVALKEMNDIITEQKHLVEEKHREITDSINYAERIQRSFLATKDILDHNLKDYFVFFKPKDVVSGDFYWASHLNNGNFTFCCADSTGHGVPGAIMSILNISSLEKAIEKENEPHHILNKTRELIIERLKKDGSDEGGKDGMDCSLMVLNPERTKLTFASANNPVFIIRNGELLEFKGDKMPVGKHQRDQEPFLLQNFTIEKGDVIYSLTDGFPDQFGGDKGRKYMIKNLKELFLDIASLPMAEQEQKLNDEFNAWMGDTEQIDDVCIIGVKIS